MTCMLYKWGLKSVIAAVNIPFLHILHIQPNDGQLASWNIWRLLILILIFMNKVDNWTLLGYYAVRSGNSLEFF